MQSRAAQAAESPVLLEASGLRRAFALGSRRIEVLDGASLHVRERECVAIVGRSGAGKSTLLHVLGALDRPQEGSVWFRGEPVFDSDEESQTRYRARSVGFVFQFHHLLPEFTAVENVMMPARIAGQADRHAKRRAHELLERVGLSERADHRPSELSGGEQQRVALARALMNDPALLLADEPSGNLDLETGRRIYDLFLELSETLGHAVVVATHSAELASRADRVLELHHGTLHARAGGFTQPDECSAPQ
jgi:lipoprotein-releasing system ATP-binding protein